MPSTKVLTKIGECNLVVSEFPSTYTSEIASTIIEAGTPNLAKQSDEDDTCCQAMTRLKLGIQSSILL